MMNDDQVFTLLQHGDSIFPSGSVSFSWGLEMLKNDNLVTSSGGVEDFIESQLHDKWGTFERVVLAHCYEHAKDLQAVIPADNLVECMTLPSELREGSKRLGSALLSTYVKLDNPVAKQYQAFIHDNKAHGHLVVSQGLLWYSIGLPKNPVLTLSAYNFCTSALSAALRLGLISHIDFQMTLTRLGKSISKILTWPVPEIEEIHGFTPVSDIASMRHEKSETRLFIN